MDDKGVMLGSEPVSRKDWYTRWVSGVLFPMHEALKGHQTVEILKCLEKSQWLTPEAMKELQLDRLKTFLTTIEQHVPYYQTVFAELGVDIGAIDSLDDLTRFPLLTKDIIRAQTDALKTTADAKLMPRKTGGSTGEPLRFFVDNNRVSHDVAARWRATRWWGVDMGDPELVLWGAPAELGAQDKIKRLRDKLFRSHLVSAFDMTPEMMVEIVRQIRAIRPRMIFGYPSSLAYLARYAKDQSIQLSDCGVHVVFVTSEVLYPQQRQEIEQVFGCGVANEYGGRDAGFIARECSAGRMHISAEDIIVELVDDDGNPVPVGFSGEVVVTHLATTGFPFLRYKTGDIAIMDDAPCACGRGLPVLKEVVGRSNDLLITCDGGAVHPNVVNYIVREFHQVIAYKVIQETLMKTRVLLELSSPLSEDEQAAMAAGFRERLGSDVEVDILVVDYIQAEKSGKHRFVVSHCSAAS